MLKVILQILALLWKAIRVVLWARLRRILGRLFFYGLLLLGVLAVLVMIAC